MVHLRSVWMKQLGKKNDSLSIEKNRTQSCLNYLSVGYLLSPAARLKTKKQKKKPRRTSLQLMDSANDSDHTADLFLSDAKWDCSHSSPLSWLCDQTNSSSVERRKWQRASSLYFLQQQLWLAKWLPYTSNSKLSHWRLWKSPFNSQCVKGTVQVFFNSGCVRYFSIVSLLQPIDGCQHAPSLEKKSSVLLQIVFYLAVRQYLPLALYSLNCNHVLVQS